MDVVVRAMLERVQRVGRKQRLDERGQAGRTGSPLSPLLLSLVAGLLAVSGAGRGGGVVTVAAQQVVVEGRDRPFHDGSARRVVVGVGVSAAAGGTPWAQAQHAGQPWRGGVEAPLHGGVSGQAHAHQPRAAPHRYGRSSLGCLALTLPPPQNDSTRRGGQHDRKQQTQRAASEQQTDKVAGASASATL
eukprot:scaffold642_cov280-Prasinococcus_capsulatus_cf.AAC.1